MLTMARNLVDPSTKQATAFYAALAISVYDVFRSGFHPLNTAMLAAMAGITVFGALAALLKPPDQEKPE